MKDAHEAKLNDLQTSLRHKSERIATLEKHNLALERQHASEMHDHDKRLDQLADNFAVFMQEQMARARPQQRQLKAHDQTRLATSADHASPEDDGESQEDTKTDSSAISVDTQK